MKKTLLLFCAAFGLAQTILALTIEEGKYYTIKANSDKSTAFMADNNAADDRIEGVGRETPSIYWQFVPTGNTDCYYIKNCWTNRYIQSYPNENEKMVKMGNTPVEYYVKSPDGIDGRFYFAVTSNSPHDFTSGTKGLNLHAESYEDDCYVQSYNAVATGNGRSQWTLKEANSTILTTKVYTLSGKVDNDYYIKDNGDNELKVGTLDNTCLWQFEDAGNGLCYVKNVKTGRYIQACGTVEANITIDNTPVAYVIKNCSEQEEALDCFGLTSANQSNTDFTEGCVGLNWRDKSNDVQCYNAKAGTNHRSFWKFTEYQPQAIDASGYASYGNTTDDVIILGAQAYKGTAGTSWLSLSEVSDVPANNGVIIKGSLYAVASTAASADMTGNSLLVSDGTVTSDGTSYALSTLNGTAEVGFYPVGNGITIPAGKAYLNLSGSLVKGFTFVFEDETPTAIAEIKNENLKVESPIFNLAGQRLQKMQKGINIINGKKVLY